MKTAIFVVEYYKNNKENVTTTIFNENCRQAG